MIDDKEMIRRLAIMLDAAQPLLDKAAKAEKRREAGKRMRQITAQLRADDARELVTEADAYVGGVLL